MEDIIYIVLTKYFRNMNEENKVETTEISIDDNTLLYIEGISLIENEVNFKKISLIENAGLTEETKTEVIINRDRLEGLLVNKSLRK